MSSTTSTTPVSAHQRRIVLTAFGSLGDLHPYIAIALGLRARGHDTTFVTSACYRNKIESLGLRFQPTRPDSDWVTDPDVMRRYMHPSLGTVRVVRERILPLLRDSYANILTAAEGADLLVSHPLTAYATRLVAETTGLPWASTMVTPLGFFSAHDLPVMPLIPTLSQRLRFLGPAFWGPLFWVSKRGSRFLARPWYQLRAELGLPPTHEGNPLADTHSPTLVLALFSATFAAPQPDWPRQARVTGFPIYDGGGAAGLPPDLARFLDAGPPPVVFTLGASASVVPGGFFESSVEAARRLGVRAVVVTGNAAPLRTTLPAGVFAAEYAPYSELFPRAVVVVHHGGIGTTGLALRAGQPMLVVPFSHDNPDNAARIARLGVGRVVLPSRYGPGRVAAELRRLLDEPEYARRAAAVGKAVRQEDGVTAACDALEDMLGSRSGLPSRLDEQ